MVIRLRGLLETQLDNLLYTSQKPGSALPDLILPKQDMFDIVDPFAYRDKLILPKVMSSLLST